MANKNINVSLRAGTSLVKYRSVFSHDSKCLFVSAGHVIKVFSTISGQLIRELTGHTGCVTGIQINPTNRLQLLSCSEDGFVIKWDFNDGVLLKRYNIRSPLMGILTSNNNTYLIKKSSHYHFDLVSCSFKGTASTSTADITTLIDEIDEDQRKVSIGSQGEVLAAVKNDTLTLKSLTNKKTKKHVMDTGKKRQSVFTCVACHPTDHCVVTGFSSGKICYWRNIFSFKHVVKSFYHWHSLPVKTLTFSTEGSYLLSGGHECVLVKWQYDSQHNQDFLPRLGAPIEHITCSSDSTTYAVSHSDNVIHIISNSLKILHIYEGLTAAHLRSKTDEFVPTGLLFDPRSKALVLNGRPGHLQFYSVHDSKQLFNLDIVSKNYISPENLDRPQHVTEVKKAAFSDTGDWLVTFQIWDDGVLTQDSYLKFWQFNRKSQGYILNTMMGLPHEKELHCLKFRPDVKFSDTDAAPLCVSTSEDGKFKLWNLMDDTDIYRENSRWNCDSVGFYRGLPAGDASFSEDGSLLAVVFEAVITLWIPDTNYMKTTFTNTVNNSENVSQIQFGRKSCCHLLVSTTKSQVVLWNLKTSAIQWCINIDASILVADPLTENMAVFTTNNNLFVFRPSDSNLLYTHSEVCSSKILSALFLPHRKQITYRPDSKLSWQQESQLYFFTQNQELLNITEENDFENDSESQVRIQENLPQTPFSILLSEHRKTGVTKDTPTYHEQHSGKAEANFIKELTETPAHVLPPMSSLCQNFIETLLLGKKDEQQNSDSEENSDNEMDTDDSDAEQVPRTLTEQPSQKQSIPRDNENEHRLLDIDLNEKAQQAYSEDYSWFFKNLKSKKS